MIFEINSGNVSVKVNSLGAELMSIQKDGREYLWHGGEEFWNQRAPMLFPIIGGLEDDVTIINEKEYRIGKHGFLKDMVFNVESKTLDSILLTAQYNSETLSHYPFRFRVSVDLSIQENSLMQKYTIENMGADEMIYAFGLHPGFNLGNFDCDFEECYLDFHQEIDIKRPSFTEKKAQWDFQNRIHVPTEHGKMQLSHELFKGKPVILDNLTSGKVTAYKKPMIKIVEFSFDGFELFGMWHGDGAPFVCLEPWTSHVAFLPYYPVLSENPTIQRLSGASKKEYCVETKLCFKELNTKKDSVNIRVF